ncbi:carbonic anhydrase family protein [Aliikangiella maris]|uniref:Carbonic anhydrase family protein n=2 Tax=Aliikangiella maris TaxID=3162458 RepID=A0ABV3MQE2_9GAMM
MKFKLVATLATTLIYSMSTQVSSATWGYDGQTGDVVKPADWGTINAACNGSAQSPINIVTADVVASNKYITPHYNGDDVSVENNGHTVNTYVNRYAEFEHSLYRLDQFHFHVGSEHTIDGQRFPLEVHFVNKKFDHGTLVDASVIGIMIQEGATNQQLANIFSNLPDGHEAGAKLASNLTNLLPANRAAYNYRGSLTTPGCNEIVNWFVMATPITMSAEQIDAFKDLFKNADGTRYDTYRPVQPLNGRVISHAVVDVEPVSNNHAPEFAQASYQSSVDEGDNFSRIINATDADGDTLTYSMNGAPAWLSINAQTGEISGSASAVGQFNMTIQATDPDGASGSAEFTLTVNEVSGGLEPIDSNISNISVTRNQWQRYNIDLAEGYSKIIVTISGGNGDADLYVRYGAQSTTSAYDCRPYLNGNNETCTFNNPQAGVWYIDLRGYDDSTGINLRFQAIP